MIIADWLLLVCGRMKVHVGQAISTLLMVIKRGGNMAFFRYWNGHQQRFFFMFICISFYLMKHIKREILVQDVLLVLCREVLVNLCVKWYIRKQLHHTSL